MANLQIAVGGSIPGRIFMIPRLIDRESLDGTLRTKPKFAN